MESEYPPWQTDHGYRTTFIEHAQQEHDWKVEIEQKSESVQGFVLQKNRGQVERWFGWLNRIVDPGQASAG